MEGRRKCIRVRGDIYLRLKLLKKEGESFSDVIQRICTVPDKKLKKSMFGACKGISGWNKETDRMKTKYEKNE